MHEIGTIIGVLYEKSTNKTYLCLVLGRRAQYYICVLMSVLFGPFFSRVHRPETMDKHNNKKNSLLEATIIKGKTEQNIRQSRTPTSFLLSSTFSLLGDFVFHENNRRSTSTTEVETIGILYLLQNLFRYLQLTQEACT